MANIVKEISEKVSSFETTGKSIQPTSSASAPPPKPANLGGKYNHEMYEQAIEGLIFALKKCDGDITAVTNDHITASADIEPVTLAHYYKDAQGILKDIHKDLKAQITETERVMEMLYPDAAIRRLFQNLQTQPRMLHVSVLIQDFSFWEKNLRPFIRYAAESWAGLPDKTWLYLYRQLCHQFMSVLEKWQESNFSKSRQEECADLLRFWIDADFSVAQNATILME